MKKPALLLSAAAVFCLSPMGARAQDQPGAIVVQFDDLPIQVEIADLKRTDDNTTITLRGVVRNPSGRDFDSYAVRDMYLIDFKNRRKYLALSDNYDCVCAPAGSLAVHAGGATHFWAKFPAPPEPVTTLSFGWKEAQLTAVQITR